MIPKDNEARFKELNLLLPPAPVPMGVYTPLLQDGKYVYVSGHLPVNLNGSLMKGKVGSEIDMEEGKKAAQQAGLTILSTLVNYLGSLNRIKRVIKVFVMVNSTADFEKHPYVINGCSELFVSVFGPQNGAGVRSAVGVSSLPENVSIEIEAIFELENV